MCFSFCLCGPSGFYLLQDVVSTEDTRVGDVRPLIPPACLSEDIPLTQKARDTVRSRPPFSLSCSSRPAAWSQHGHFARNEDFGLVTLMLCVVW